MGERIRKLEFTIQPDGELIWNSASHDFCLSHYITDRRVNGKHHGEDAHSLLFFPKLCSSAEVEEEELDNHSILRALAKEKLLKITIEVCDPPPSDPSRPDPSPCVDCGIGTHWILGTGYEKKFVCPGCRKIRKED